ncbi:TIGR03960 family B12-binding radical SAM protein [Phosphitispora sp. TUW77]|uniref:TIGR03960 family B12-binding radical SAM protein n=1 Tax=Phosphitispora sp. TUW77 TaxID=3152361 RepID=UPI003AB5D715
MKQLIENRILPKVQKPARYQGNEWNSVHKDWNDALVRMVFAFPDVYEVGMSHLGLRILYHIVNNREDTLMERVFAPWVDMEEQLRQDNLRLFSLESVSPLADFDVIAFTLQYEMSYTNLLNMLDMAGIPLRAAKRDDRWPLVLAGGPTAYNPEPLAPFVDAFLLGEGEEAIHDIIGIIKKWKQSCQQRKRIDLLKELAGIPGVYVPEFYEVSYHNDGTIKEVVPQVSFAPPRVTKRVVRDLDKVDFPTRPIVPFMEIVHDRIMLEVLRGCSRGCRFCQAGMIYRPVREKRPETLVSQADHLVKNTGYDEISLTSLSTSDYSCVQGVLASLMHKYGSERIGVSLPSLRADTFSVDLAKEVQRVRKTTLTFAPEAGTQRMRDVINKGVTEDNLMEAVTGAFEAGWTSVKLYFMIGLPSETYEDLDGIADLAFKVVERGRDILGSRAGRLRVTVSASSFVPKPHTPFQWVAQDSMEVLQEKQHYLARKLKHRKIVFNWHDARLSTLEAVFSRGSRRVAAVLERAWELGCKFDSWNEHFNYDTWQQAFRETDVDPGFYNIREFGRDEVLPWDHINTGVTREFLLSEYKRAFNEQITADCRHEKCTVCGVCQNLPASLDLKGARNNAPD